jgi:hypothetical protein
MTAAKPDAPFPLNRKKSHHERMVLRRILEITHGKSLFFPSRLLLRYGKLRYSLSIQPQVVVIVGA